MKKKNSIFACDNSADMSESCQTRHMYGHDYAVPGTYEVTIVVAGRRSVFGKIAGTTKING